MHIIQFMDMKSTKYGGLGKFMIRLMERCPEDQFYFVFQNYPASKEMVRRFEACGAKIEVMNTASGMQAIRNIPQFIRLIKRIKPDVIHFHFANSFFIYAPIAKLFGVKKLYKTQHCCLTTDDSTQVTSKRQFNLRTKLFSWNGKVYRLFDKIIMCGDYVQEQFEKVYGKSKRYQRIYFGVEPIQILTDKEKEALRNKLQIDENDIVITTIAFADPIKGVDVLVKAIPFIKSQSFIVVIVGVNDEVPYGRYLHELAKEINVEDRIRWIGITDHVNDYLSISNIYCQPSRSEALTLAVCEAKSAHLPVVGAHVGGLPEISELTFETDNPKSLSMVLELLLDDSVLREELADNSYKCFKNMFDVARGVEEYYNIYSNVK